MAFQTKDITSHGKLIDGLERKMSFTFRFFSRFFYYFLFNYLSSDWSYTKRFMKFDSFGSYSVNSFETCCISFMKIGKNTFWMEVFRCAPLKWYIVSLTFLETTFLFILHNGFLTHKLLRVHFAGPQLDENWHCQLRRFVLFFSFSVGYP